MSISSQGLEQLELRTHLSCGCSGRTTLKIYGTEGNDSIRVALRTTRTGMQQVMVTVNKVVTAYPLRTVRDLYINAGGGNDRVDTWQTTLRAHVVLGDGNDTCFSGAGDDTLIGGNGGDQLCGEEGNDFIDGGQGNNILSGMAGSDTLYAGDGMDMLEGDGEWGFYFAGHLSKDFGNDVLIAGGGQDTLDGDGGDDYIDARDNDFDSIYDHYGNNTILMDPHRDTLRPK